MFNSIVEDIKNTFRSGNMVSRLIFVNVALFIALNLLKVFDFNDSIFSSVFNQFVLTSDLNKLVYKPWVVFTHMFTHIGFMHILWNMLLLYWFGRIVGDLLGDRRILPLYIVSGLFGALIYLFWDQFLPGGSDGSAIAFGASGAVMAFIFTAATLSPDYQMRLLFLGDVRLKYIAIGILFMDLIVSGSSNKGGFIVHLAGAVFGVLFITLLRQGFDLTSWFKKPDFSPKPKVRKTDRSTFKVVHKQKSTTKSTSRNQATSTFNKEDELDRILDKITAKGFDKLSDEEKDFLSKASKD